MKKIIGLLLIAIVLTLLTLWSKKAPIESYLQGQISQALQQEKLTGLSVRMDGREAYLQGSVPLESDKEKSRDIAKSVWGVGGVHLDAISSKQAGQQNLLSQVRAALKAGNISWASAGIKKLRVAVSGSTSDPEQFSLVKKVLSPFGSRIDNLSNMDWASYFKQVLAKNGLGWASASANKDTLTLTGEAPDQGALDKIASLFAKQSWFGTVDNQTKLSASVLASMADKEAAMKRAAAEKAAMEKAAAELAAAEKATAEKATSADQELAACKQQIQANDSAVYFGRGKADLSTEATQTLDQLQGVLARCKTLTLHFSGHTDSRGNQALNQALSQQRVQTVLTYLQRDGMTINANTQALADEQPKSSNQTATGRQQNRRVEWQLID